MNDTDTGAVLEILGTAWPNHTITDKAAFLWMEMLGDIDPDDAMHATRVLIKRENWFPSIAQFRIEAEAKAHARRNRHAAERGLSSGHKPAARLPTHLIADMHARLTEVGARKHWHGGPDPCPVCGGLAPPAVVQKREAQRAPRPRTGQPLAGCQTKTCLTCYGPPDPSDDRSNP